MKKLIGICLIALAFFLNSEKIIAQNKVEVNTIASEKTETVRKSLKFNPEQRDAVFEAFKFYQSAFSKYELGKAENKEMKAKYDERLKREMKVILTAEQFERYLQITDQE